MAAISLIRESSVGIFEETGGWLFLEWILIIKKSIRRIYLKILLPPKMFCDGLLEDCKIQGFTLSVF